VKSKRLKEKQLSIELESARREGCNLVHVSCLQMTHCNHKLSRAALFRALSLVKYEDDIEVLGKTASVTESAVSNALLTDFYCSARKNLHRSRLRVFMEREGACSSRDNGIDPMPII